MDDGRQRRPLPEQQDPPQGRGHVQSSGVRRKLRRPQHALRHPRARHGRHRQRHGALRHPCLRRGLPDLRRLHAHADAPGGPDAHPVALGVHARLHRRRRGRPHAPADRTACGPPCGAEPGGVAPLRCQRGQRGLPLGHGIAPHAEHRRAHPPERAHARPHALRPVRGRAAGRLRAPRPGRWQGAGSHPHRYRQRGLALR